MNYKAGRNRARETTDRVQLHGGWLPREHKGPPTWRNLWVAECCSLPFPSHYFNVTGQSVLILTNICIIQYNFVVSGSHLTTSKRYVYYALLNSLNALSLFEKLFTCSTVILAEQSPMLVWRTGFKNSLEILNPEASTGAQLLASVSFA